MKEIAAAQGSLVYILGDADRVRERIEALLLGGDLVTLRAVSLQISNAIKELAHEFERRMSAEVIVAAGDDLLIQVPPHAYNRETLEILRNLYQSFTGGSISFGVGDTVERAYLNLRRAKSSSTQKIFASFESKVAL